ncbi:MULTISPECIES: DUF4652 domain-containing protein [Bacillus]|uniref:DUF4652 domain-containing protein n=1 Tax=Bacillus TaxID=1386 RepID=UPI001FCB2F31|nr:MULTISPECIES: DUF4652 domain-containing protein [Bacillus]
MYKLEYDYDDRIIYKVENENKEKMDFEYPSEPLVSPDRKNTVFIDPLEWEVFGSLYLFNNIIGEFTTLIEPEGDFIPKFVKWIDHETLGVIIGFGHGTVAIGGNIFTYNISSNEKTPLTEYGFDVQITSFDILPEKKIKCKGIKYTDEAQSQFIEFEEVISL